MPTIDPTVLQELKEMMGEDSSEVLAEVIDSYLNDAPILLQAIHTAVAQEDVAGLERAAHALKSSSATLGAIPLSEFCKELEAMGRVGTIQDGLERASQLEAEYVRVKAILQLERSALSDMNVEVGNLGSGC